MSVTTVVDFTDAQMLDYTMDGDLSMQNSPADWLTIEATMADDNPATDYSEAIEVDMEFTDDHDGEITEYEMADGAGDDDIDYDGDTQFQDAEVEEHLHELPSLVMESAPDIPHSDDTTITLPPSVVDGHFSVPPLDHAEFLGSMIQSPEYQSHVDEVVPVPPLQAADIPASTANDTDELSASLHGAESSPVSAQPPSIYEDPTGFVLQPETQVVSVDTLATDPLHGSEEAQPAVDAAAVGQEKGQESVDAPTTNLESTEGEGIYLAETEDVAGEDANEQLDPHEISEGVYIDPPPAVLLSLPASEHNTLCLFNHPVPSSRSQSPEPPTSGSSAMTVILQQHPTLYYEPLNRVFAALRQEQIIYSSPELSENELVLEAYDMSLSMGEDNVYASQITIHDLNDTHDRVGLTGPLRLRLSSTPRFITRYHALRDQIAQIALNADDNDRASAVVAQEQSNSSSNEAGDTDASEQTKSGDPEGTEREDEPPQDDQNQTDPIIAEQERDQSLGEPETRHAEDIPSDEHAQSDNVSDNTPEAHSAVNEYGTELTEEEAAEGLDADEVHHSADAEEGGDYTEYAEDVPDDDDDPNELPVDPVELAEDGRDDTNADNLALYDQLDDGETLESSVSRPASGDDETKAEPSADNVAPAVVRSDEVALIEEEQEYVDDAADHDTEADSENDDGLYDFDDSPDGQEYLSSGSYANDNWDELEDVEPLDTEHANDDTHSKQSSETLSTLSKRSREEDDEDEDGDEDTSPGTPDLKRIRTR
ncbi:hypothetical protein BDW22DRAFT_1359907 [Trametopsis cervina]|nr:hypothetical protein BDW22DRAFT_1359907 [Trametopsis cervina]